MRNESRLPSFSRLLASLSAGALLGAAGCAVANGEDGKASFSYLGLGSELSHPLAVGASAGIDVRVPTGIVVDHATSSDPTVFSVGQVTWDGATFDVPVSGLKVGSATLTVYDAGNNVIDLTVVQVATVAGLQLSAPSGLTVLAYQGISLTVTASDARGESLAGGGEIQAAYAGPLSSTTGSSSISCLIGGCASFQATAPGDGQVNMTAQSVTASLSVHAVPVSAIDSFTFGSPTVTVTVDRNAVSPYTLSAAGVKICSGGGELTCTSSEPTIATLSFPFDAGNGLSAESATGNVIVEGLAPGAATITCTVNGKEATFGVTVTY